MFFCLFAYLFTVLVYDVHINGKYSSKQTYNRQASNIWHVTELVHFKLNLLIPVVALQCFVVKEKSNILTYLFIKLLVFSFHVSPV